MLQVFLVKIGVYSIVFVLVRAHRAFNAEDCVSRHAFLNLRNI